jgi:hypothetical protein
MKATIQSFLDIASSLASESNYDRLLARVSKEMSEITGAKSACCICTNRKKMR